MLDKIIAKSCPMDLGEFISLALVHHKYGYYINRDPFGVDGDFTTAPEISQLFGEMIGAWVGDIWMQMGSPASFNIIECGAGRGTLMADIMRVFNKIDGISNAVQIIIIEASDLLKSKQRKSLNGYNVSWYQNLSDVRVNKPCITLGNEFLDALPIEQLRRGSDGWQKRVITVGGVDNNEFKFDWQNAEDSLTKLLPQKTVSNEIYEVSPERIRLVNQCNEIIKTNGGVALFIDYGHIKSHHGDTLQAVKNHKFINVLEDIGNCDITSHIDFEALSNNLIESKITTQRNFLKSLGIKHRANAIKAPKEDLERLIGVDQMGDLFKVMCLYNDKKVTPAGF